MNTAPIILFVHRRPEHTRRTLEALSSNRYAIDSELIIFSDAARSRIEADAVDEVRQVLKNISGFRLVHCHLAEHNQGLAKSIINGVSAVMNEYEQAIIVEDDLITSTHFLHFMNKALQCYRNNEQIFSITGYNYSPDLLQVPPDYHADVYLSHRGSSWGWATWRNRWQSVDWDVSDYANFCRDKSAQHVFNRGGEDLTNMLHAQMRGKIDSWAIRWAYARSRAGAWVLTPVHSYIRSIGHDGSGTHCADSPRLAGDESTARVDPCLPENLEADERILEGVRRVFRPSMLHHIRKLLRRL